MTLLLAILLATIQGLTEFLPISSSGHLRIFGALFGLREPSTAFDVILHVGSLISVVVVFRRELVEMFRGLGQAFTVWRSDGARAVWQIQGARLAILLVISMVPTAVIGLAINAYESALSQIWLVGALLMVNGLLLSLSRWFYSGGEKRLDEITARDALLIGVAQGGGVLRGISRSGSTIIAGMGCGLAPQTAFAYSFLLSIPAILGALVLKSRAIASAGLSLPIVLSGLIVSAVVGYLALVALKRIVVRGKFYYFAYYCWIVGLAAIVYDVAN